MAIGAGSLVALKNPGTGVTLDTVTYILFGIAEGSLPGSIVWQNGTVAASVPAAAVDEILDASADNRALLGSTVQNSSYPSPAASGLVVGVYKRGGTDVVLVQTQSGAQIEFAASSAVVRSGQ